ncbi:MAG TPA: hypothetical protein VNS63_01510 [Blastocatellia bacterium]|nr:hypothetical protein [Blastocatellia bacterium]
MPNKCTICRHEQRGVIETTLVRGVSLRDIARQFEVGKDAVSRHRECIAKVLTRVHKTNEHAHQVNVRTELERAIADVKELVEAAREALQHRNGAYDLRQRGAVNIAKVLLQASDRLDKHLRMLGDLTGVFKQPQPDLKQAAKGRYDDIVNLFTNLYRKIIPELERIDVVRELANCPHIAGEYMPLVRAELDEYERDGPVESACIEG